MFAAIFFIEQHTNGKPAKICTTWYKNKLGSFQRKCFKWVQWIENLILLCTKKRFFFNLAMREPKIFLNLYTIRKSIKSSIKL